MNSALPLAHGARCLEGGGLELRVWAPRARSIGVRFKGRSFAGDLALARAPDGFYQRTISEGRAGDEYVFVLDDGRERPDPASRWQPHGVHGASRVVDPAAFAWNDAGWDGVERADLVLYELHVGTFTERGTFEAAVQHFERLRSLGITAVELMPVAEFPGSRNWGYDGVFPYAPQSTYGGPFGLARLVDAAHVRGLAVFLDVVYNHLGPEGNVLGDYAPYFTDRYKTPWGDAINFDGADSDEVRRYFIENALQWISDYHIDGLRLDAIHAICDFGAQPFLAELAQAVGALGETLGRQIHVIGESDRNDPREARGHDQGGLGLDALWNDDFHHAVHVALTDERRGYYVDFGGVAPIAKVLERRFAHDGGYSCFRRRRHGAPARDLTADRFVAFVQNHDQVGNRACGERLTVLVTPARVRLAAALLLLSPYIPLLFMGEEFGETAPFLYFVDHGQPKLRNAVRRGRRREFREFGWKGEVPDPAAEETFRRSRLDHSLAAARGHRELLALYAELLRVRRELTALRPGAADVRATCCEAEEWLAAAYRPQQGTELLAGWNLATEERRIHCESTEGTWRVLLSTDEPRFGGGGAPLQGVQLSENLVMPPESARLWEREVV